MNTPAELTIRALTRHDLPAVVDIDASIEGRRRSIYVERRLAAAVREPEQHVQLAAVSAAGVVGYMLARVLEGEFGRRERGLRLELLGVRADQRAHGVGTRLLDAMVGWAGRHGIGELRTGAAWRDAAMLGWLAHEHFELAPDVVLDRAVGDAPVQQVDEDDVSVVKGSGPGHEVDFGRTEGNDHERLTHDRPVVHSMAAADLNEIVRIDRGIVGRDRGAYIDSRLREAMDPSGVRVSLTARLDGAIAGFVMARADHGDFGRTQPVAVLDTLGVDPQCARRGVAHALLAALDSQLHALHIERAETVVDVTDTDLLGFFVHEGFRSSQRLAFRRRLAPPR